MIKFWIEKITGKKRVRQARYTFNPSSLAAEVAVAVTIRFPVTIGARDYNKLPPELQPHFQRGAK